MPGHLRVPGLTGDLPASLSAAALTGLLRGELGFTGVIISDALEMRAVSEPYGMPEAAVRAVAAGTDLLCLGRDQDQVSYLAVRDALASRPSPPAACPPRGWRRPRPRVADLRAWISAARRPAATAGLPTDDGRDGRPEVGPSGQHGGGSGGPQVPRANTSARPGRRPAGAARVRRPSPPAPPAGAARGSRPRTSRWGRSPGAWRPGPRPTASSRSAPARPAATWPPAAGRALAIAAGRSLVVVVRDAHRRPAAQALVTMLLAARPDTVVVEMGLPVWRPPGGGYVATYGAGRSSGQAAAEALGLTGGPAAVPRAAAPRPPAGPAPVPQAEPHMTAGPATQADPV